MGVEDVVPHEFRSRFRDSAAEQTNFPPDVAKAALAYVTGDKVEAAYQSYGRSCDCGGHIANNDSLLAKIALGLDPMVAA